MHVSSACPLRVARLVWRPSPEASALTVVCKATFALEPGLSPLAPSQEAPWEVDVLWDDDPRASLRAASDLAPFKRRADVLVVGHAHAPRGELAASLVARLAVGAVDKRVEVHGPRAWTASGQLTAAAPFARAPLRWERAASGADRWNPVGIPASAAPDARGLRPAPSLLPPGVELRGPAEPLPPAGFGPIAPSWPERAAKLRRHAASFGHGSWAERPLPEDIDPGYFNVAPPDQQLEQLVAGERIVLAHLHPRYPHLATALEAVIPHAALLRGDSGPQEMRLRCDTLWIDADRGICTLTWRGAVPLRHPAEDVTVVVTAERPRREQDVADTLPPQGAPAAGAGVSALADGGAPELGPRGGGLALEPETTLVPVLRAAGPSGALPFVAPGALPVAPATRGGEAEARGRSEPPASDPAGAVGPEGDGPDTAAPGTLDSTTLTSDLEPVAAEPLPFHAALARVPAAAVPAWGAAPPWQAAPAAAAPAAAGAMAWQAAPAAAAPAAAGAIDVSALAPAPELAIQAPEARSPRLTPPPPPLLGQPPPKPAAGVGAAGAEEGRAQAPRAEAPRVEATRPETPRVEAPHPDVPRAGASPAPEPAARPEDIPVERFASISAEIAEQRAPRAEVLRAHGLSERAWAPVERHFRALLEKDTRAGGRLLAAHDAAYVAAVEGLRGPIGLQEYARIAVGLERGMASEVLDALAIQRAALMPIVRVWTKKAAGQMALSAELMALLEELRAG
ncbi:DUF2169 domain-containing protein [Sorangium sp. So ce1182]|uniref:DUF2169 family type VI secretion system accessory protein n=1 Tax=Sorangium sp. So ce1182 TaxID=3133334 RepID=UPI003F6110F6